jgi:mRNA (guanine-N(7))-methyltransferase domain/mRNA capping enzyme, catalytic domain
MSDKNDIKDKIGKDNVGKIKDLFKKITETSEFEFIFFSKRDKHVTLTLEKYISLLKILTKRSIRDKKELKGNIESMDISYNPDRETSYRCTLENKEAIDKYMKKLASGNNHANNHVIFRNLVALSSKDKNISVIKKSKAMDNTIDVDDFYMRVRSSEEIEPDKKEMAKLASLDESTIGDIVIRFKERTSLYILNEKNFYLKIDLTKTRTESRYSKINSSVPRYELEIEAKSDKADMEILDSMFAETEFLFKILQQSNFIISRSESENIVKKYKELMIVPSGSQYERSLYGRQPISLEIQYVQPLANKYAVTDKADGERHFLVILFDRVYLINKNLDVKDTGIVLKKDKQKYNNSVVDGELLLLKGRHVFLVFDCLFNGGNDVRKQIKLEERLKNADDIINNCFIFDKQKGIKYDSLPEQSTFNLDKTINFHKGQVKKMFDNLNHDIDIDKKMLLVRRKYFIHALGAKPWEIYAYSSMMWNSYTTDPEIKCPYTLDGLIYQPNDQAYIAEKRNSKFFDYKWKPPSHNSIDFYIEFVKEKTGNILTIYDNSHDDIANDHIDNNIGVKRVKNQPYKICKLYVGQMIGKKQSPTPFRESENLNEANLLLKDGDVRDMDGNILSDKTVVEFYYNMAPETHNKFRWIPMRTRYDKTEAVLKHHEQYGNFSTTADNVWKSINNPVLMTDFDELARGNNPEKNMYSYDKKLESLNKKIGHEQVLSAAKENAYFQKVTNLAKPMRAFHNHIKDNLIYTLCHSMYDNRKRTILDIGVGRGADIMKYYYAQVAMVVGIDIDREGLVSPLDGAVSRYNNQKRKAGFPKMYFIQADFNSKLDYENQFKSLGGMDSNNKQLMDKFFSKTPSSRTLFDVISAQFSFHYGLRDSETFSNLKENINNYLRNDGCLIITTFDAYKVRELLKNKDKYTQEYTDEDGNVQTLFEIVKKYQDVSDDTIMGTGNTIDVYMSWFMNEGTYQPEYLVDSRFLIEELKKDCDMDLITTNSFENQYALEKDFFTKYAQYEADERTRKNFFRIEEFYKSNSLNDGCKLYTSLERLYVFRKRKDSNKRQKGGDFTNTEKFYMPTMTSYNNKYTLMNSIHHVLRSHQIIPQSISPQKFFSDIGLEMKNDTSIFKGGALSNICGKIIVNHDNGDGDISNIVDGINILIAERDCNNEFDTTLIQNNQKAGNKTIIVIKEGYWYAPIYAIDKETNEKTGLFDQKEIEEFVQFE